MKRMSVFKPAAWLTAAAALSGCATVPPVLAPTPAAPTQWASPLPEEAAWPHEGRLQNLVAWWRSQGDPVLAAFVEAAQQVSPSISSAAARIAQARAERATSGSTLLPQLDAVGSAQRRSASPPFPAGEIVQGGLQLSWELDVFGGQQAQRQASQWRLLSADAGWHEARVSLAADVALQVLSWRHCHATLQLIKGDAQAAGRSAQQVRRLADAGLQPPEQAVLAESGAAEARNRARAQAQRCDTDVKALVQYTARTEAEVRERLESMTARKAEAGAKVDPSAATPPAVEPSADLINRPLRWAPALPASTLAQRPDVFMAAAAVAAAAADVGTQQAQRYPRVGLSGSIGRLNSQSAAGGFALDTWSVGPLSVSVPVFDGGRRAALVEAAKARHADALVQHRAVVRRAVREVEEALLALDTTAQQEQDARLALDRARSALHLVRLRAREGLASELQVDEALRRSLGAEVAWLDLQRNRVGAWVGLYRAAGGGWNAEASTPSPLSATAAP
jgi:NodT family efflux transporter outer membrane factor (OMF) lipoprotein